MKVATLLLFAALLGLTLATPYYRRKFKYAPYYPRLKHVRIQEERASLPAMDQEQEHSDEVRVSTCNAMFAVSDNMKKPDIPCSEIATLTVATIRSKCPIVSRLPRDLLQQRLDHLQEACRRDVPAKHSANIQSDSGMDYLCKFYRQSGFISYLKLLCRGYMPNDKDIPEATLNKICEEEKRNNLGQYLIDACSERSPDMMPAGHLLAESASIPAEHTEICTVLSRGDEKTANDRINRLCEQIDGGGTSLPDVDRVKETHWGLCTSEVPDDRLEMLCSAIKKGYMKCPSGDIPELCQYITVAKV